MDQNFKVQQYQNHNQQTVDKFAIFLNGVQDQKEDNQEDMPVQRKISTFMADLAEPNKSKQKVYKVGGMNQAQMGIQANLLTELKQRMQERSQPQFIKNKIVLLDDGSKFSAADIKRIVRIQSQYRGRVVRRVTQKLLKNQKYRQHVIQELIQTEQTYLQDILLIQKFMEQPLRENEIITMNFVEMLFCNIDELIKVHQEFFKELQIERDGNILIKHSFEFKVYYKYCNNYTKQDALFTEISSTNQDFLNFINLLQKQPQLRGLGWSGFLVKPVQRLPKYILLINDFIKHTEQDHPLLAIYAKAYDQFKQVCQENNEHMEDLAMQLKLFELQKDFGDPNGHQILESKRRYLFEERLVLLLENQEKNCQIYVLNDLMLVCEKDETKENGYRLLKYVQINARSYCQSIPNKRFLNNLTRLVAKNHTLTFVSQTADLKQQLQQQLFQILQDLKQTKMGLHNIYQIEVQVIGTEERNKKLFSQYTVYVIQITIERVVNKVFLRYSEIKKIVDFIEKECQKLQLPQFQRARWVGNKESKVIENRKVEIEEFILSLLSSEDFQSSMYRNKILQMLGLDIKFFELPSLLKTLEDKNSTCQLQVPNRMSVKSRLSVGNDLEKMSSVAITSSIRNTMINQTQNSNMEKSTCLSGDDLRLMQSFMQEDTYIDVCVSFHDDTSKTLKIPSSFRAHDLLQEVARSINLKDCCDFRLFETDDSMFQLRPIMEDEIINNIVYGSHPSKVSYMMSYIKKKVILFRKYLNFPQKHEQIQDIVQQDNVRLNLITCQMLFDIKQMSYDFVTKDYVFFTVIYLMIKTDLSKVKDNIKKAAIKIIPTQIYKEKKKKQWYIEILQLFEKIKEEVQYVCILNMISKKHQDQIPIVAENLLINIVNKQKFYGVQIFPVKFHQQEFHLVFSYLKTNYNKTLYEQGFSLAVSNKGLHFIDQIRRMIYTTFHFSDFDEIIAYSDQVIFFLEDRNVKMIFQTTQGFYILSLIQDYQYLELELQNIRMSQS